MENKINEFMNYLQVEKNCSLKTLRDYRSDIEQFLKEMNIDSIEQITKHSVRGFLAFMANKGAEATTRNRKLTAIRSFCKYLVMEEYLVRNPTADIPLAKVEKKLPKTMNLETTGKVIESADNDRDKAVLETLYGTGCRVEELVGIKLTDINFENATVRLFGKGAKERIVPISVSAIVAIVDYIGNRTVKSEYLFPSPNSPDKPITTRAMYNVVVKYGKANNVAISPHKFRHSIATHLLSNGMDIRKIQELLGHANINTTTIYAQVAIDQMATQFHSAHPRG